mmetsp:Transcript_19270/g.54434  ORF Transcript_19270/g.54434 Transcript_19270/m.54434 type:complete len:343 (-) Transcript_19270:38-1066(-)
MPVVVRPAGVGRVLLASAAARAGHGGSSARVVGRRLAGGGAVVAVHVVLRGEAEVRHLEGRAVRCGPDGGDGAGAGVAAPRRRGRRAACLIGLGVEVEECPTDRVGSSVLASLAARRQLGRRRLRPGRRRLRPWGQGWLLWCLRVAGRGVVRGSCLRSDFCARGRRRAAAAVLAVVARDGHVGLGGAHLRATAGRGRQGLVPLRRLGGRVADELHRLRRLRQHGEAVLRFVLLAALAQAGAHPPHEGRPTNAAALGSVVRKLLAFTSLCTADFNYLREGDHGGGLLAVLPVRVEELSPAEVEGEVPPVVLPHAHHRGPALLLLEPGAQLPGPVGAHRCHATW